MKTSKQVTTLPNTSENINTALSKTREDKSTIKYTHSLKIKIGILSAKPPAPENDTNEHTLTLNLKHYLTRTKTSKQQQK